MKLIHHLNQCNAEGDIEKLFKDQDFKESLELLKKSYGSNQFCESVQLRSTLMQYDISTTDAERKKSLEDLKKFCFWNLDHIKPSNLKKIKK